MALHARPYYKYRLGEECVFNNRITSDTKHDGKRCVITRLKHLREWHLDEPEYVIFFLEENHETSALESELEPITDEGEQSCQAK